MIGVKDIINSSIYATLVVLTEVVMFYGVQTLPSIAEYSMLITIAFLGLIGWALKPNILTIGLSLFLVFVYGVVSYELLYAIYFVGYPETLLEFIPEIAVKTLFFTLPIVFLYGLRWKKKT